MKKSFDNIGAQIKVLRENSGFTQKNIANYLGVDQSLISKFEAGERPISADMLERLVTLFGCSISVFKEATAEYKPLSLVLRASEIGDDDLETISAINKIALNSAFMTKLLESEAL
ncbi:helix-turn-helix transcriptional regulator [Desulfitobacterium sp.]|uniref:helix-turn-helix domain-containing protein n=1 Tax=Desulfitobacterium sp. TaxID=49981 RepID=UPI002C9CF610|nr:helix-turn-helix transcriptional regulator [Desulfitobacterium sp.]HVJ50258.1 helix-turn-helix transcriptional regulator [Desulfitobacterium sp.]